MSRVSVCVFNQCFNLSVNRSKYDNNVHKIIGSNTDVVMSNKEGTRAVIRIFGEGWFGWCDLFRNRKL